MSVFRQEALHELKRWSEPLLTIAVLLLAARLVWVGVARPNWIYLVIGGGLAPIGGSLFYLSMMRLKISRARGAAGIVEVRERNIVYFSPHLGGDISLDGLQKIAISPNKSNSYNWVLYAPGQRPLIIPFAAKGADRLLHAFSALPGLSLERLNKALNADRNVLHIVWQRAQ